MDRYDDWVTRTNLDHFKRQLKSERDPHKRWVLEKLLKAEEQKLSTSDEATNSEYQQR